MYNPRGVYVTEWMVKNQFFQENLRAPFLHTVNVKVKWPTRLLVAMSKENDKKKFFHC